MKKIVAMMLALVLVLSMASVAWAASSDQPSKAANSNLTTVKDLPLTEAYVMDINKGYVNNDTANSTTTEPHPADVETFFVGDGTKTTDGGTKTKAPELYVSGAKVNDASIPAITLTTDTITEGNAVPQFHVTLAANTTFAIPGEYVYYIYETVGTNEKTAGVTYNYAEKPLILKITVVNKTETKTVDGKETTTMVKDSNGNQILQIGGVALRYNTDLNLQNATQGNKLNAQEKDNNINDVHNEYEFGKVTVNKTVTGNMGDTTKPWVFKATFTPADGETVRGTIRTSGSGTYYGKTSPTINSDNGVVTGTAAAANIAAGWTDEQVVYFTITHNQNFVFDNIPEGVTYKIEEVEANKYGYTTTSTGTLSKAIAAKDDLSADFTNDKTQTVDTGVSVTMVPYLMILAVAMVGAAMMIIRRRKENM